MNGFSRFGVWVEVLRHPEAPGKPVACAKQETVKDGTVEDKAVE